MAASILIVLGVQSPSTAAPPHLQATPTTCGAISNPHNGFFEEDSRGSVNGARGYLRVRGSDPCDQSFTTLYTMLFVQPNSWVQVGYYKSDAIGGVTKQWVQRNNNGTLADVFGDHVIAGDLHTYEVRLGTDAEGQSVTNAYVDGLYMYGTSHSTFLSYWNNRLWHFEISEEAFRLPSNVPGTSASQANTYNMQFWPDNSSTVQWVTIDCSLVHYVNDVPSRYSHTFTGDCANQALFTSNPY